MANQNFRVKNGINVGTAVTITTGEFQVGNTRIHSGGIEVKSINVSSGVSTFTNLVVSAGTTSAPAITLRENSNTGIFFPETNSFAVSTNGTEKIKVSAGGTFAFGGNSGTGISTNRNYYFYTPGNAVFDNISYYFESGQDLGNAPSERQYGMYSYQRGARYTNQTAIYAEPLSVFGGNYRGVHGVTSMGTQAGGTTEAIFGETTIPTWNYQGRHCAVRGIAQGGSNSFLSTYGLGPSNGAFGGHFVAYGKADVCGVYADAYQLASPGAGTTAVPLMVATNGTELLRVNTGGELLVGTVTRVANGGKIQVSNGITFPATQSACTDPNTLDDYEEGTWTPAYSNTGYTYTYTAQEGTYTKVGRLVTLRWRIEVSARSGSPSGGQPIIFIPFASSSALTSSFYFTITPGQYVFYKDETTGSSSTGGDYLNAGLANSATSYFWLTAKTGGIPTIHTAFIVGGVFVYETA